MLESVSFLTVAYTLGLSVLVAAALWLFQQQKRPKNLPPGPPPNLILGNLVLLQGLGGFERLEKMTQLADTYDGMCTIYLGSKPNILVNDYELIKRILNEDNFTGRPYSTLRDSFYHRKGLLFTDGELWKEQRRFALSTLRDFGMGKTWLQDLIIEEAQELVRDIEATKGKPINPSNAITPSVANVICAISYGKRFSHQDENFTLLTRLVGENISLMANMALVEIFPILRHIPFNYFRNRITRIRRNLNRTTKFLRGLVDDHKANLEGEPRDYIHAFLNEANRQKQKPNTTFTEDQLEKSIINLFGAGTETTSTTLTWAMIYLLQNPDVYRKVQAEVDSVIPGGEFPHLEEKESLQYMQAVIMEVQRLANLVPFPARGNIEATTLKGYNIPVNTTILPNLYAVHMNPKYFPDPHKFDPTRFLDDNGKIKKVEGFLPFSIGKRFCLGESLAKMELYIFFASLLKHFNFLLPPGETASTEGSILGIVNAPKPFEIIFAPRTK